MSENAKVVAIIATRFRADLLLRLFESLPRQTLRLAAMVVTDNGPDPATLALALKSPLPLELLSPKKNLGYGGGLALAGQRALEKFPDLTHLLVLDDDVILSPGDVENLTRSMDQHQAGTVAPFLTNPSGILQEVPEPILWSLARSLRKAGQNLEKARALAPSAYPMAWCVGPCLLIRKDAWLRAGPPRSDMLAYGDDVEFSLRLSAVAPAWAEPGVTVIHAPPEDNPNLDTDLAAHYRKFGMLLQNLAFTCVISPRARHLPFYLPGNARRFFRTFGLSAQTILEVARRYSLGLLGIPAGR
ncbi:MAG: glycosyltransferase family 2 protein [Verrucomicrobia bacterium]|nr:glycosyltransferase family 2 protein [Verrucomicrobiota bacterium]